MKGNKAELFWNSGKIPPQLLSAVSGVKEYKASTSDGSKTCKIKTEAILMGDSHAKDLSQDHFLLLAGGSYNGAGSLGYHSLKGPTGSAVSLARVGSVAGGRGALLFQLHGVLMLAAWLGCAGAGMIMARYFKKTWRGRQLCGKDLWFVLHRGLMTLAVVLTIAAVILVLVEVQVAPLALSSLRINPHPVVGLVCVLLALLQPIMAALRPHPGTSTRPLFNWAHWAAGNSAFILGVVAIFLAGSLAKTNLASLDSNIWSWSLLAFVIFHSLIHLILSLMMAKEEISAEKRSGKFSDTKLHDLSFDTTMKQNIQDDVEKEQPHESGSLVRTILFGIYLLVAFVISIVMIDAIIAAARPRECDVEVER